MTRLLLRADASPAIGVGHLSRCVAVAAAARARGWDVALWGSVTAGEWLLGDLPVVTGGPADVVVVDHYGLGELTLDAVVVSIEDGAFGRRRADVVVDANLAHEPRPDDGSPVVLRGPEYAPLRAEVRAARDARSAGARSTGLPPKVVVVMGGGAAPSAVAAALTALGDTGVPADVLAISSVPVPGFEVTPPTPALPALFASADLVVSAAGVTLLELCCVGVPTALVQVADNQAAGYQTAVARGLAVGLGTDPREHVAELRSLLRDPGARQELAARGMATVDGRGADRILDAAERALSRAPTRAPTPRGVAVRPAAAEDADLLLAWRNDPDTRAWSRTADLVSSADHRDWLDRVLANPERKLLIAEQDGRPVGTVRFDRGNHTWEVSITLAPAARGKGLAVPVLLAAERTLDRPTIHAIIHRDNAASLALFERAGYRPESEDGVWHLLVKSPSGVS